MADAIVEEYRGFVNELVTPERKNIVALTEIARDALQSNPQSAPGIADAIVNRILHAPPEAKLPPLYLLDSISKNVGEPFRSIFSPTISDVMFTVWTSASGGPRLHHSLERLLSTWASVFPSDTLETVRGRLAVVAAQASHEDAARHHQQQRHRLQHQQRRQNGGPSDHRQQQQQQHPTRSHPRPHPDYAVAAPPPRPMVSIATTANATSVRPSPSAPVPQTSNVSDLLSSLMNAGVLAPTAGLTPSSATNAVIPIAPQQQQQQRVSNRNKNLSQQQRHQAAPLPPLAKKDEAYPIDFNPNKIKADNPAAVARLLKATEATKHSFLDRKFFKRKRTANVQAARMWYVDVDTWLAGSISSGAAGGGGDTREQQRSAGVSAAAPATTANGRAGKHVQPAATLQYTVPVDESQPSCALSGEKFEQVWNSATEQWVYKGVRKLEGNEAAAYGLPDGALVLVSVLGDSNASTVAAAAKAQAGTAQGIGGPGSILAHLIQDQEAKGTVVIVDDGSGVVAGGLGEGPPIEYVPDMGEEEEKDEGKEHVVKKARLE
jgi:pre-mRNA cleavage complex 2 protein Pcf11